MPFARVGDVDLYYEETGSGTPLVFLHEFADDMRGWEPQVRYFSRRYRVIAFNYRGYPPSGVPDDEAAYGHETLVADLRGLLDALDVGRAHIVGLATGGNLALNFAIAHPERVYGIVAAGAGAGTVDRERWLAGARRFADDIQREGTAGIVANVTQAPQRIVFRTKDPIGWDAFVGRMRTLSPVGTAHMMRNALINRHPVFELGPALARLELPVLVMVGDQDTPAVEPSRFIRDHAPHAGLAVLPMCGHTLSSEEPALFNDHVARFLAAVDAGRWGSWAALGQD